MKRSQTGFTRRCTFSGTSASVLRQQAAWKGGQDRHSETEKPFIPSGFALHSSLPPCRNVYPLIFVCLLCKIKVSFGKLSLALRFTWILVNFGDPGFRQVFMIISPIISPKNRIRLRRHASSRSCCIPSMSQKQHRPSPRVASAAADSAQECAAPPFGHPERKTSHRLSAHFYNTGPERLDQGETIG